MQILIGTVGVFVMAIVIPALLRENNEFLENVSVRENILKFLQLQLGLSLVAFGGPNL